MQQPDIQQLLRDLQSQQLRLDAQNDELLRVRRELSDSNQRYSDLYEHAPIGCLTIAADERILEANSASAALLKVERSSLIGRSFTDFIAPESQAAYKQQHQSVLAADDRKECDLVMRKSDGTPMNVRLSGVRASAGGSPTETCKVALIDNTAQHHAEYELRRLNDELDQRVRDRAVELMQVLGDFQQEVRLRRATEERLQQEVHMTAALIDTAQAAILLLDTDGRIVLYNHYLAQLSGHELSEVKGKDWFDTFLPPSERIAGRERFRAMIEHAEAPGLNSPIVTKDGQRREMEWCNALLRDGQGQLMGLLCTGQDVTERHMALIELRKSREQLAAVLSNAVEAIITIDLRGIIIQANPAAEQMFGYPSSELIGQNVKMLMPSPHRERHDQYIAHYLRTGERKIIGIGREVQGRRKDGSTFPVDLSVSEVDHLGLFTGILRDLSEHRRLERHLAEVRADEQRHIAQELHDGLGGQMTGIAMLAKTLQMRMTKADDPHASDAAELVGHIRDAHEQLRKLARGLQPVDVGPGALRQALCALAEHTTSLTGVPCRCDCDDHVTIQSPDHANHLYRIAQEAVANAIRHARPRSITISLKLDHTCLMLSVQDDGSGIQEMPDGVDGMGLRTMRYRASQINAGLTVEPAQGGGTVVRCTYHGELTPRT